MSEPEDFVVCRICGKKRQRLQPSHFTSLYCQQAQYKIGITVTNIEEYKNIFQSAPHISNKSRKNYSDSGKYGTKNKTSPINQDGYEPEHFVICRICNNKYKNIDHRHLQTHNITYTKYHELFPNAPTTSLETKRKHGTNVSKGLKGRVFTKKHKINIGLSRIGIRSWNKGLTGDPSKPNYDPRLDYMFGDSNHAKKPEVRQKISASQVGRTTPQSQRDKLSKIFIEKYAKGYVNPFKGKYHTEESIEKMRQSHIGKLLGDDNPSRRPEVREILRQLVRQGIIGFTGRKHTQESKDKIREGSKQAWVNLSPEEKQEWLSKSLYKGRKRPNMSEKRLMHILGPIGYRYNGKGPIIIKRHIPDFIHITYPLVIEYDGPGGHDPLIYYVPENIAELDDQRDQDYRDDKKEVLRILAGDLERGDQHIYEKIRDWMVGLGYAVEWEPFDLAGWFE